MLAHVFIVIASFLHYKSSQRSWLALWMPLAGYTRRRPVLERVEVDGEVCGTACQVASEAIKISKARKGNRRKRRQISRNEYVRPISSIHLSTLADQTPVSLTAI